MIKNFSLLYRIQTFLTYSQELLCHILSPGSPVHILTHYFLKIHLNIILPSPSSLLRRIFLSGFQINILYFSSLPYSSISLSLIWSLIIIQKKVNYQAFTLLVENRYTDLYILNLDTSWWMVSFTAWPLYPRGKSARYPLDMRLVNPWIGLDDVEKRKFLTIPGIELRPLGRPTRSQELYRLRYSGSFPISYFRIFS
jgi:hypothetical protein